MYAQVHPPEAQGANLGSCVNLATYMDKEASNIGFFSHTSEGISVDEVISSIDYNVSCLGDKDAKFYMLSINPSHEDLCNIIGRQVFSNSELTPEEQTKIERTLVQVSRYAMDAYALNFGRESIKSGNDLLYYGRIETTRIYKPTQQNISEGAIIGAEKSGLNYHAHIIVSRKSANGKTKLSPNVVSRGNDWELKGRRVKRGFNHEAWKIKVQDIWDNQVGISNSKDRYIPKESLSSDVCPIAGLRRLLEYRYKDANHFIEFARNKGYNVSSVGGNIRFVSPSGEVWSCPTSELRARETIFVPSDIQEILSKETPESSFSFREKWGNDIEVFEFGNSIIDGRELNRGNVVSSRDRVLLDMPEDLRKVFQAGDFYDYKERLDSIKSLGYSCVEEQNKLSLTKEDNTYQVSISDLKHLEGARFDTLKSIGDRINIEEAKALKDAYPTREGISIDIRYNDEKGYSFLVVKDEQTNSCVKLSSVEWAMKGGRKSMDYDPLDDSLLKSPCKDIRELANTEISKTKMFLREMESRGYKVEEGRGDYIFKKEGVEYSVKKIDIKARETSFDSRTLVRAYEGYMRGDMPARSYTITYVDKENGSVKWAQHKYIFDEKERQYISIKEAGEEYWRVKSREEILQIIPPSIGNVCSNYSAYNYRALFPKIEEICGYKYEGYERGVHTFVSSEEEKVSIRHRDFIKIVSKPDDAIKADIVSRMNVYEAIKGKEAYVSQDGTIRVMSVERTSLDEKNKFRVYEVHDSKTGSITTLGEIKKASGYKPPYHNGLIKGASIGGVSRMIMAKAMPQEVTQAIKAVRAVGSVTDPTVAMKKQLMKAVIRIVSSAFKSV